MNNRLKFMLASLVVLGSAFAWASQVTETPSDGPEDRVAKMDQECKLIIENLKVAPFMEVELENDVDPVSKLEESGFIVEISREEVEAAVAAAVATPDPDDDQRALELMHRGSYRFYLDQPEVTED